MLPLGVATQGIELGPGLFVLVINDLQTVCESYQYVDDTCIVYTGSDTHASNLYDAPASSTLDQIPWRQTSTTHLHRLHWIRYPGVKPLRRTCIVYTGSDTHASNLYDAPASSTLDQIPWRQTSTTHLHRLHWIRYPRVKPLRRS